MTSELISKSHNFSLAFEQMCSIVAIGKTKGVYETIKELILHCFVLLPEDNFSSAKEIAGSINGLFGLSIQEHEIDYCLKELCSLGVLEISASGFFTLKKLQFNEIKKSISDSYSLEVRIRESWKSELGESLEELDFGLVWSTLKAYLAKAFQRHGIQTIALIDPAIDINHVYTSSLSALLDDALSENIDVEKRPLIKKMVSDFMATTGSHPDRAKFISELADGAFTYFSLTIDPNISKEFRDRLESLVLYLDTNFIFGIIGLTSSPQVAVSKELIEAINKFGLPFELKCSTKTIEELNSSITIYEEKLSSYNWSKSISRAAITSRNLSGVELRFHERFLETGLDVHSFFNPYHHADEIIKGHNISICPPPDDRLDEKSHLISDYTAFLDSRNKSKPYELIDHDMTLLDQVRLLRNESDSSLNAGALVITCDFSLYRFDWEISKRDGRKPCTVLPNIFWQILRPFIPSDIDFDRSFAETFAIPEFRIIGSNGSEACSKMLSILAGYEGFPEETAARMLSNDILIDQLQKVENDRQFQELIELEIIKENASLVEENRAFEAKYEVEKLEKQKKEQEIISVRDLAHQLTEQIQIVTLSEEAKTGLIEQEKVRTGQVEKEKRKFQILFYLLLTILLGAMSILLLEFFLWPNWAWLSSHPKRIGLHICFDSFFIIFWLIVCFPKWRKLLGLSFILPIVFSVIQLIDK